MDLNYTDALYLLLQQAAFLVLAFISTQPALSTRWFAIIFNLGFGVASFELMMKLEADPFRAWFGFAGLCFIALGATIFTGRGSEGSKQHFAGYYAAYNLLVYIGYALTP